MSPRSFQRDDSLIPLGRAVRAIRTEREMSQVELALKAEAHVTYVSRIEHGGVNLTWVGLRRISQALGMKMSELVRRAEEIEEDEQGP